MKNLIITICLIFIIKVNAQVGIGTTNPRGALEINSSTNGLIIPRVALTDVNSVLPVVNPAGGAVISGTLVWNTNTASGLKPGYYYWLSNEWIRLASKGNSIQAVGTSSLVEPNANIPGPLSTPTTFTNTTAASFDNNIVTRNIPVSGLTGNIGQITCNVKYNHTYTPDVSIYLESPTGQIIELSSNNGGGFATTTFDVIFSDSGVSNINTWFGGNISGVYKPSGSLIPFSFTPTITTMSGFNGFSPNGTWKLRLVDDFFGDVFNFQSVTLSVKTIGTLDYKLIGETSFVYSSNTKIVTNATYSANCVDDDGVITALSLSSASAGALGTTVVTVPGTVMSYASDSPKQGSGNYWVTTHNQATKNGLIDGNTYYIQLWVKGNVETPLPSNQIYSIIPVVVEE